MAAPEDAAEFREETPQKGHALYMLRRSRGQWVISVNLHFRSAENLGGFEGLAPVHLANGVKCGAAASF
jgi:hypothetical protein